MGFFTTKKEVKLEYFCRDFYEKNILSGIVNGVDVNEIYYKEFIKFIEEVFPEFSKFEFSRLKEEFTIIRFELFALAWQNSFSEDLSIAQSIFTLHFLKEKNQQDIWERMGEYNSAISSGIKQAIGSTQSSSQILDMGRFKIFKKYMDKAEKEGVNTKEELYGNAIARVGNRIKSNKAWNDGRGMVPYHLFFKLLRILGYSDAERIKISENPEVPIRIMRVIQGFYDGAKESWKDIEIINN